MASKILCFSDNNEIKFGRTYGEDNLYIVPPIELIDKFGAECYIIVASSAFDIIKEQMVIYGFSEKNIFLFNFAFMDLKYTDHDFIFDHIDEFERAYARMADNKSKRIFELLLNYRITKDINFLEELQVYVDDGHYQYFDKDLIKFRDDEILLDVGAYIGDTLKVYDEVYEGWKGYIGFEVDTEIFNKLSNFISHASFGKKCKLLNYAAWDKCEKLYFKENPGSSSMKDYEMDGNTEVCGEKIDNILSKEKVTFVKMDIEGSEYQAISGMKKIISDNKPIMAICVYHRRDDYYRLTDLIESILPNEYTYYFRQYRYTPTETVCYAVPKDRILEKKRHYPK